LREYLSLELPDYMIPAYFVPLEKMPLTSSGKVDRRALPDPEYAAAVEEYVPPGDKVEEILAGIWQKVLGIEKIGITDHFFKNGGDSIKAIQVSARLKAFGMSLKVNDLFSYPTISQLGKCVKYTQRNVYQGITTGEAALTPIQQWFFEKDFTGKHHFNHAVMLYKEEGFNETFIEKIFAKLVQHHDALRMVYDFNHEGRVVQRNRGVEGKLFDFEIFHFENKDNIKEQANRVQAGINIEKGPLVKVRLFKTPEGDHLLVVIHHLVVDGVSWRILLEDFSTGYRQLQQGETLQFQQKSDSFKDWSCKLEEYSESKALLEELEYWKKIEEIQVELLPVDHKIEKREKKLRDNQTLRLQLNRKETGKLLTDVHRAYNTNMNDILLTALAMALKEWAGIEITAINLESHGREPVIEEIDTSRTVGWFTAQFPVLLDIKDTTELSYSIKSKKETLRHIPNNGIGYGILKYLTPPHKKQGVSFTLEPQVNFNYLGQFDDPNGGGIFTFSHLETGNAASPEMESIYNIDINGMVVEGALTFSFTYNKREYETASIEKLLDRFHCSLLEIIEHCTARDEVELTPSDLGDEELSLEELDHIKEMINL
jgi:non-ribosomal peptide synthase protein (TIGR01720 family)